MSHYRNIRNGFSDRKQGCQSTERKSVRSQTIMFFFFRSTNDMLTSHSHIVFVGIFLDQ